MMVQSGGVRRKKDRSAGRELEKGKLMQTFVNFVEEGRPCAGSGSAYGRLVRKKDVNMVEIFLFSLPQAPQRVR